MILSVELAKDILSTMTPSPAPSRSSLSSKTPGRDLEDMWILDSLMLDLDKTFSKTTLGYIEFLDTISSLIKNIRFLLGWKSEVLMSSAIEQKRKMSLAD